MNKLRPHVLDAEAVSNLPPKLIFIFCHLTPQPAHALVYDYKWKADCTTPQRWPFTLGKHTKVNFQQEMRQIKTDAWRVTVELQKDSAIIRNVKSFFLICVFSKKCWRQETKQRETEARWVTEASLYASSIVIIITSSSDVHQLDEGFYNNLYSNLHARAAFICVFPRKILL